MSCGFDGHSASKAVGTLTFMLLQCDLVVEIIAKQAIEPKLFRNTAIQQLE